MAIGPFCLTRNERLHLNRDFKSVFRRGGVWHNGAITLFALNRPPEKTSAFSRIGIVIPRKTAGAVQRNRLKRRIREIFRLNKNKLNNPVDIIIIGKKNAIQLNYAELEKKILGLWHKAKLIKGINTK